MLFIDVKWCCFNSIFVYKQMSTAVPVEASLGCTFHAELKLFTLLLLTPKYLTCLIESNLKGSCLVQTVRVWHRCFASPKLLHPVFFLFIFLSDQQAESPAPLQHACQVWTVQLTFPAPFQSSECSSIILLVPPVRV